MKYRVNQKQKLKSADGLSANYTQKECISKMGRNKVVGEVDKEETHRSTLCYHCLAANTCPMAKIDKTALQDY